MERKQNLLNFELINQADELNIHCSENGLKRLIKILNQVLEAREHEHLMTPSWGGKGLTEEKQGKDSTLLNKVTVHLWD